MKEEFKKIIISGLVILVGLILLKFIPMFVFGDNILYDASAHIAVAVLVLYILWFFVDQNKSWRIPYFVFAFMVLTIISLQRIVNYSHNDIGLLLGFILGVLGIGIAEWKKIKNKLRF
jgi:hypothetical protein